MARLGKWIDGSAPECGCSLRMGLGRLASGSVEDLALGFGPGERTRRGREIWLGSGDVGRSRGGCRVRTGVRPR